MQNDDVESKKKFLKKLRDKAELCRFSHSELKEKCTVCRNWKEFSVFLLSVVLTALGIFYYRGILAGDLTLSFILILPLAITMVQALDHTVFLWTRKMARHESAVAIWGDWIREADFLEKHIHRSSNDLTDEKMQNIQEKYNGCMGHTEQIPNNVFLKCKKKFRVYVLKSKKIDEMSSEDMEKTKKE